MPFKRKTHPDVQDAKSSPSGSIVKSRAEDHVSTSQERKTKRVRFDLQGSLSDMDELAPVRNHERDTESLNRLKKKAKEKNPRSLTHNSMTKGSFPRKEGKVLCFIFVEDPRPRLTVPDY